MATSRRLFGLTALRWPVDDDWLASLQHAPNGLLVARRRRTLLLWDAQTVAPVGRSRISFVDGWALRRVWLGTGKWVLGLNPQRLFFEEGGSQPSDKPVYELVDRGNHPRKQPASTLLDATRALGERLAEETDAEIVPPLEACQLDTDVVQRVVQSVAYPRDTDVHRLLSRHGFDKHPRIARISIVRSDGVRLDRARMFQQQLDRELSARSVPARTAVNSGEAIKTFLESSSNDDWAGRTVVFLMRNRQKHEDDELKVLRAMEARGLPFRRAYASDNFEWSVRDQVASIVTACGGRPFRLKVSTEKPTPWMIGIDLSHRGSQSSVCVTLVDPDGTLQMAWRSRQVLNESVRPSLLEDLLTRAFARAQATDSSPSFAVYRDGRWPDGSSPARLISLAAGHPTSLIEVRKSGNPLLFDFDALTPPPPDSWTLVGPGCVFAAPDSTPRAGGTGKVLKVTWRQGEDGLELGAAGIAELTLASRYAPALGSRTPTLPIALYWADGIAGASDADLRFRGQPVEDV